jgi:hypothetical protein
MRIFDIVPPIFGSRPAGERSLHTGEVVGSIPTAPTNKALKIRINSKSRREPEGFHAHFGKLLGKLRGCGKMLSRLRGKEPGPATSGSGRAPPGSTGVQEAAGFGSIIRMAAFEHEGCQLKA